MLANRGCWKTIRLSLTTSMLENGSSNRESFPTDRGFHRGLHLVKSGKYPTVTRPTRLISKAVSRKLLIDSAIGAGETFWARRASSLDAGILSL